MFTFSCGLPTWRLIPDQFKWCSAGTTIVEFLVSVIIDVVLYPAVVLHHATVPAFGSVQVSVMDGWKISELLYSVVVDEWLNGKCSQNEMSLYPPPIRLCM